MQRSTPSSGTPRLRYSAAPVFEVADLGAVVISQLYRGDAFTVLGSEGSFRQVRLPDGATGFVYENNLIGVDTPPPLPTIAQQLGGRE